MTRRLIIIRAVLSWSSRSHFSLLNRRADLLVRSYLNILNRTNTRGDC